MAIKEIVLAYCSNIVIFYLQVCENQVMVWRLPRLAIQYHSRRKIGFLYYSFAGSLQVHILFQVLQKGIMSIAAIITAYSDLTIRTEGHLAFRIVL